MSCTATLRPAESLVASEQPCRLLQLPDEVKLEIVKHVQRKRDLYNFSLACHSLEDMTLGKLYKSIDLDIPSSETPEWSQESLPTFRPYVLQNMRELAIRNGLSDVKNPIYHKRRRSDANTMEGYVGEIFKAVPQDRLKAFSFQHQAPISLQMIDGLAKQHGRGLKHLQCCEVGQLNQSEMSLPSNLRSLECRSVLSGEAITKLIAQNKQTLQTLSLGQDKYLLQQYRERRIGFLDNIAQPFSSFHSALDLSTLPNLKSLSLSGLDLAPLVPQSIESALFLTQLESITFESCPNTVPFLDMLTATFNHVQTTSKRDTIPPHQQNISLKKFSFRNEFCINPLRDSLTRFLTSFKGLTHLSLLIENSTVTTRPSVFLTPHGPTLQTLVLESRVQPREHLSIDTSRPFGSASTPSQRWLDTLNDITSLCPNLLELGTAYPWDDTTVNTVENLSQLHRARNLHTLHIRNYPSSQTCLSPTENEALLHSTATNLVEKLNLPSFSTLQTLAVGPTLYTSRWRLGSAKSDTTSPTAQPQTRPIHVSQLHGSTAPAHQPADAATATTADTDGKTVKKAKKHHPHSPPEHLQTHYFVVEGGKVVDAVDERHVEEVRGRDWRGGLGGVFDGIWLR